MEQKHHSKYRFWVVGSGLMIIAWLADSLLDAWMENHSLADQILHPTPHELAIRCLFLIWQLLFLLYLAHLFRRQHRLDRHLAEALAQAEFERNKAEAVLEGLGDGISLQDPELRVLYQNAAHRAMVGDHVGEYCYRAYQSRDVVCPQCHLMQSFKDKQVHIKEANPIVNGEELHVEIVSTPLFDASDKLVGGIESVRNITERKRAERELRTLARDLQQRTEELEAVNNELEAFSYSLSHDLRDYLTRINLAAGSMHETGKIDSDSDYTFCLKSILRSCEEMDELISAMLTLGRATRSELQIGTINLSAMAATLAAELTPLEKDRHITFDIEKDIYAEGDEQLLQIALKNLLGNACKYTRKQADPKIALKSFVQDGERIYAVADNGQGFDMQEAERLFQPFQRLSSSAATPGLGIGLATVHRIIQRHCGRIWATAKPEQGATFYFTLGKPPTRQNQEHKTALPTSDSQAIESI